MHKLLLGLLTAVTSGTLHIRQPSRHEIRTEVPTSKLVRTTVDILGVTDIWQVLKSVWTEYGCGRAASGKEWGKQWLYEPYPNVPLKGMIITDQTSPCQGQKASIKRRYLILWPGTGHLNSSTSIYVKCEYFTSQKR